MKHPRRVFALFVLLATLLATPTLPAKAAAPASADFLNLDGTLRMEALSDGALDLRGWDVQLDPVLGPILQPAALNGTWSGLGSGIGSGGTVFAIAVSGSNVYVGGVFTSAGGIAVNNIAVWNSTTSTWSALGSGVNGGLGSGVAAIAVSGSNVYVGGSFTSAGGIAASRIAVWNSATSTWSGLGSGVNDVVHAIAVSGSNVYVGGFFTSVSGIAVNNIAVWNSTTSTWSALGSGLDSSVRAIALSGSNVYAGGDFTHAGAVAAYYIAVWNGSAWSALGGGGMNGNVYAIAVSGSNVYVGGWFTQAGGNPAINIAAWNSTTSTWSALGSGLEHPPQALAVSGSNVYAGGFFTTAGGVAVRRIAVWNSTNSTWSGLGSGVYPGVYAIAVGGSNVYAGGTINDAGGIAVNRIARFQVDPPTVVFGAGSLPPSEGANLTAGPSQLVIRFSEDVLSDGSPNAANSLWNYMLLRPGPNGVFDTPISTPPPGIDPICDSDHVSEGDDERIDLGNATYNAASFAATLTIDPFFAPLENGTYRLYVCGAASIQDLSGLPLNGGLNSAINFTVGPAPVVPTVIPAAPAATQVTAAGRRVPNTGFAPGKVTLLPLQTVSYADLGNLWLEVPKLGVKMPIVGVPKSGNEWNVSWLGKNAGWLEGSAFPSWKGNSVLTGHVWNADNAAGPFRYLNTLWWGDKVIVHLSGQQYIYEVRAVKQVASTNVNAMLKHEELSWLTLVTCKGYDEKTDSYRYRVLVRAVLIEVK